MKKFLVLALLLVYGATSFGFSLNFHYCCGELEEITFSNIEEHDCDSKPAKSFASISTNCCVDQQLSISLHADQSQSRQEITFTQIGEALSENPVQVLQAAPIASGNHFPVSCNSPPGSPIPLFIRYCVFRV